MCCGRRKKRKPTRGGTKSGRILKNKQVQVQQEQEIPLTQQEQVKNEQRPENSK